MKTSNLDLATNLWLGDQFNKSINAPASPTSLREATEKAQELLKHVMDFPSNS